MIHRITQDALNSLAREYGTRLLDDVKKVFEKYRRSGFLSESVELTIVPASEGEAPKIILSYADQGFFIGQRSPQWTRTPDIEKLKAWSENIDLQGPVPGYKTGMAPNLPPWKIKERKIWAIAKSKQKFDRHKQRKWKNEAKLGNLLGELNQDALAVYNKKVEEILTAAIEGHPVE